ncbi:MAG: carbohydrate binding domain-containing protein [Patescibacteria group bacterium]
MARAEADIADQSADWFSAGNSGEVGLPDQADKAASAAVAKCQSIVAKPCASPTDCGQAQLAATQAQMACIDEAQKNNADLTNRSQWKEYAKKVSDDLKKETRRVALASAFKSSLSLMSQQLAADTATWIASGGKGQKPLFITEGWGAYLQNLGDSALGDFIDQVGQRYGVDLCKSPTLSLSIQTSINWKKPRQVRCTFSKMMTNWNTAITNPNFAFEYNNSLNEGENDISVYLKLSGESIAYVADKIKVGEKVVDPTGWKSVTDFANKVLTPGDVVKDMLPAVTEKSTLAEEVFTGTIVDFVNTFAQTLVGQLLNNFKSGLFTSGSSGNNNNSFLSGLPLPDLSSLLNPDAQPYSEGAAGAEARFNKLKQSEYAIGGPYDILSKLMTCPDDAKNNPGPTDCVIDQAFSSYIKDKKQVWQVGDDFKNRLFVPNNANSQNYTTAITYRTILILRKYRIVPIGWEIAANYLKDSKENITLGDIMDQFDKSGSKFYGLVDPYWVFKAPEVYCRRQGYGDHNTFQNSQEGTMNRDQYCADEQQCIKENADGSCSSYGYCTEERRFWNFGTTCDSRNNTCQTFKSRQGSAQSYLSNSLDYRDCNSQNAGCRWYSNLFDPISKIWRSLAPDLVAGICNDPSGCTATPNLNISESHLVSDLSSTANIVTMASACSPTSCTGDNHCTYNSSTKTCSFEGSCTIPYGASSCNLENCLETADVLSSLNQNFNQKATNSFLPQFWLEELSSMDAYTRDYWDSNKGKDNSAVLVVTANNAPQTAAPNSEIITLKDIQVDATSTYQFKFSARADYFSAGEVDVQIYRDNQLAINLPLTSIGAGWNDYYMYFDADNYATATIKIITKAGTTAKAYFDNFEFKKQIEDCKQNSVSLNMPAVSNTSADIYFNRNVQTCDGSNDGCSQFIRTKAGLGSNLFYNGGFEFSLDGGWASDAGTGAVASTFIHSGTHSLGLQCTSSGSCAEKLTQASHNAILEKGKKYILSGWVYLPSTANSSIGLYQGENSIVSASANANITNSWQRLSKSFTVGQDAFMSSDYNFDLKLGSNYAGGNIYFDDIQLEEVTYNIETPSDYSEYNPSYRPSSQLAYLKKAPDYYNCYKSSTTGAWADYTNINSVLQNRNTLCSKYAPVCTADEVDCELYTPTNGDPAVPGVAETLDVCPGECVGYQVYKQEETDFTSSKYNQFIADSVPKYCSADLAGCDEFTNLDDLSKGAENREYYVNFQVCEKPGINDGTYYTWEGDDTAGYQLKVYKLKKSNILASNKPCTDLAYSTSTGSVGQPLCVDNTDESLDDGYCAQEDMAVNPDCREFYDATGAKSYRLLSQTITISDNCHPYRRTLTQTNNIDSAKDCVSHNGFWNGNNECIYMAIPGEGKTCSAEMKGCRAYTGNTGNNVRNILNSNFDLTTSSALWLYDQGVNSNATATLSNVSTFVGGHSLTNPNTASTSTLKHLVNISQNKTYVLSFWAKGNVSFAFNSIKFGSAGSVNDFFAMAKVDNSNLSLSRAQVSSEWRKYDLGPVFVHWNLDSSAEQYLEFNIPQGVNIYLNNIILKEVQNSVYLVENSWYTPFSCDNNLGDGNGQTLYNNPTATQTCADTTAGVDNHRCVPGNMLGCSAYKDRLGNVAYLKSFAKLCRAEAAGCEKLVDTHNYDYPGGEIFNSDPATSSISVPAYNTVYLVADSKYSCSSKEMGCTSYGLPIINKYDEVTGYSTAYLKNLPERYKTDICKFNELWCEEYAGQNSFSYFKDPHGKVCEYVKGAGSTGSWVQQGTSIPCITTANQTFGTGYENQSSKIQPIGIVDNVTGVERTDYQGWAGICQGAQSGCNEYVDPLTNVYTKLKIKSDNTVSIKTNTLYNSDSAISLLSSCSGATLIIDPFQQSSKIDSRLFYVSSAENKDCAVGVSSSTSQVTLAGVYYKLSSSVNSGSCNGQVNFRTGCVLVNDRGQIDYSATSTGDRFWKNLIFDSQLTYNADLTSSVAGGGVSPIAGIQTNNANMIVSAGADRTCSNWLTCNTYQKSKNDSQFNFTENDKCLDISMCQSFADDGSCNRQVNSSSTVATYSPEIDKNKTGYVMTNPLVSEVDSKVSGTINYPYDAMNQLGGTSEVVNGDFEMTFGESSDPIGWVPGSLACSSTPAKACQSVKPKMNSITWNSSLFKVVSDPQKAESGGSYLQLNSGNIVISENIGVEDDTPYYLSFWVNTTNIAGSGDGTNLPYAEVRYLFLNGEGNALERNSNGSYNIITINSGPQLFGPKWESADTLKINQGTPWKHVVYRVTPPSGATSMKIALFSLAPSLEKGFDNTKLGGYTMWDNIGVNTILDTDGTEVSQIARTCRVYPEADAPGCRYNKDNTQYYGQYGYCILKDPAINSQQCLQWWPVDNIAGESVNDYSPYYQERMPLYYCVSKAEKKMNFSNFTLNANAANLGKYASVMDLVESHTGQEVKFYPFSDVPASMRTLLRYPNVYRFFYSGLYVGFDKKNFFPMPLFVFMKPYESFGIAGELPFYFGTNAPEAESMYSAENLAASCTNNGGSSCGVCAGGISSGETTPCNPLTNYRENTSVVDIHLNSERGSKECPKIFDLNGNNYEECLPLSRTFCGIGDSGSECQQDDSCNDFELANTCNYLASHNDYDSSGFLIIKDKSLWGSITTALEDIGKFIMSPFTMTQDDYWGGWGMFGFNIAKFPVAFGLPWHTLSALKDMSGIVSGLIEWINDETVAIGYVAFKIVTDTDPNYSGQASDPHPDVQGDILGYAFGSGGTAASDKAYASGVIGGISSNGFTAGYCDKVVQVVDSSGQQKAYSARTSPGSSYKTNDTDCVVNALYGDMFETVADGLSLFSNSNMSSCTDAGCGGGLSEYVVGNPNQCFDHSMYCLRLNGSTPRNYCGNYVGLTNSNTLGLKCCGNSVSDEKLNNSFSSVCNSDGSLNSNYFCSGGTYIYANIYHYNRYNYNTDQNPFASIIAPITGQYPNEWDSKDDVPYNQPLFYEENMSKTDIGQSRMGQVHDVDELKKLFAKSYGVWEWRANKDGSPIEGGYYSLVSSMDWSVPTENCGGISKREAHEASTTLSTSARMCFNYPEIKHVTTTNLLATTTDPAELRKVKSNSPIKLEFTAEIDPEQLPIRAYSVSWGDDTTTTFSGTALLSRPNPSDPFVLYHYYGDIAGTGNIIIKVKDNWNYEGAKTWNTETGSLN